MTRPARLARPDPALGVFDTLLVRDGSVQAADLHLARLAGSTRALYGLPLLPDLAPRVRERAARAGGPCRLRIDARPAAGGAQLDVELMVSPLPAGSAQPVILVPVPVTGGLGPHKWADRRGLDGLAGAGATALILDGPEVLEAAWANLWLLEGERLVTPPADGRLLAGVTRQLLAARAPLLGLEVAYEGIELDRVRAADAILLTSALRHAVAAELPGGPGAVAGAALAERLRAELAAVAWG